MVPHFAFVNNIKWNHTCVYCALCTVHMWYVKVMSCYLSSWYRNSVRSHDDTKRMDHLSNKIYSLKTTKDFVWFWNWIVLWRQRLCYIHLRWRNLQSERIQQIDRIGTQLFCPIISCHIIIIILVYEEAILSDTLTTFFLIRSLNTRLQLQTFLCPIYLFNADFFVFLWEK